MAIQNRYEVMYYVAYTNCNPNGDPDMGNTPRIDPQTMQGYITDVSAKRRIRNYVEMAYNGEPGMSIIIQQSTNLNRKIAEVRESAGVPMAKKIKDDPAKILDHIHKARNEACRSFYDVRTFGAVMSTGPNAGQVRGPVQYSFGKSIDKILPIDISISRMATASEDGIKNGAEQSSENYLLIENNTPEDQLRTMGRKQIIPFGLYEFRVFISANLAAETGFDEKDLKILFEAILNMYEHDHSASKGEVSVVSPLIIFQHIGTEDGDEAQRKRQAKLGCAPAHKLFDLVQVSKKEGVEYPRSYHDYHAVVHLDAVPKGVRIGFQEDAFGEITWGKLPEDELWLKHG